MTIQPKALISTVQVALPVPLHTLFDYLPPSGLDASNCLIGTRVLVPFGQRKLVGFVCGHTTLSQQPRFALKKILKNIDTEAILPTLLWKICIWASQYYCHPLGEVISQFLPLKIRQGEPVVHFEESVEALVHFGEEVQYLLKRATKQLAALQVLCEGQNSTNAFGHKTVNTLNRFNVTKATLKALSEKKLVRFHQHQLWLPDETVSSISLLAETPLTLNPEQKIALASIVKTPNHFQCYLLAGVTGSGKTEVYLQAIEECLKRQQQALVLIPEIGLSPQTLKRFTARFTVPVIDYHSKLADHKKWAHWIQAKQGYARIIIGTRSAVLLPLKNPGLIIVDEEHDPSFKQQEGFRYNARDLAIYRARQENIPIVIGSATPSLESLYNVKLKRFTQLNLHQRAAGNPLPHFTIIDVRGLQLKNGLSNQAITAIRETLNNGQQALVFINRRGYSPILICHQCGVAQDCPHCDSHLTWHRQKDLLKCHHCGWKKSTPESCHKCNGTKLYPIGHGTEKIETGLTKVFKNFPVLRIDRDTTSQKDSFSNFQRQIHSGKPMVLVGTQLISKGHHFPNIALAILIDVDHGLVSLDFRATERLAQLITQVAGRTGRGSKQENEKDNGDAAQSANKGEVLLQTRYPEHLILKQITQENYEAFTTTALEERASIGFPPFGHLALIRADSKQPNIAKRFLDNIKQRLSALENTSTFGPVDAPLKRKGGHHRLQLLLQSQKRSNLHTALATIKHLGQEPDYKHQLRWSIDVDPIDLY